MDRFIDREKELAALKREYDRRGSSLVVIYGRRRVGKTALISEFIKDRPSIYFLATQESETQNLRAFQACVGQYLQGDLLKDVSLNSWESAFRFLMENTGDGKLILVIDEFQYLGKADPAFPSVFQRIWDEQLKDRDVMVILCGSLISMMESQTLSYSSPLYGRRTAQIKLRQIPFRYYRDFFSDKSLKELVEFFAVTGGVPRYIEAFSGYEDVLDGIAANILDRTSFLYEEPYFLLQQEVDEIGSYFSLIRSIASGNHRLSSMASALETKSTSLTRYLKTLIGLDILEREVPVTENDPEKSKKGLYKIKDNYLSFWFRFVYPYRSYIESGHTDLVMDRIRDNFIDNHVSYVYEDICRERIWELAVNVYPDMHISKVGRYWDRDTEIDIVALDPEGRDIIFGECKYWKGPVGLNILMELREKASHVQWNLGNRREHFMLFSINGFTDELKAYAEKEGDVSLLT